MAKMVNTVPQGQIGTGNAQVFGVNPVAAQFGNQLANLRKQQELEAQKRAKAWRDNALAASSGRLWAQDMADVEKDFINRGIQLQQQGIDPYGSSPEALEYQKDKRYVQAQQGFREKTEKQFNDLVAKINANPDKYDPKSIAAVNDFFTKTKLADAFSQNMGLPQLSERFDVNQALKGFRAITKETKGLDKAGKEIIEERLIDEPATQNMIIGALARDPRGQQYIAEELTSGFDLPTLQSFDKTYEGNKRQVLEEINGIPGEKERLAAIGIVPGTPVMEEYISEQAQQRTQAKRKFDTGMKDIVSSVSGGLNLFRKETPYDDPNQMSEYQRRSLALRERALRRKEQGEDDDVEESPKDLRFYYGAPDEKGKQPSFTGKNTVGLTTPAMNMHGAILVDAATGRPTEIADSANKFSVVELTNAPVATKDIRVTKPGNIVEIVKAGSIVQDTYARNNKNAVTYKKIGVVQEARGDNRYSTYYIDADLIPTNSLNKQSRAKYDTFMRSRVAEPAPATKTKDPLGLF